MIENRNESELEAHLRRVVKHSGNLSGVKSDRGNEKSGPRTVGPHNPPLERDSLTQTHQYGTDWCLGTPIPSHLFPTISNDYISYILYLLSSGFDP